MISTDEHYCGLTEEMFSRLMNRCCSAQNELGDASVYSLQALKRRAVPRSAMRRMWVYSTEGP